MSKWNLNTGKVQENMSIGQKLVAGLKNEFHSSNLFEYMKDRINNTSGEETLNLMRDQSFTINAKKLSYQQKKELMVLINYRRLGGMKKEATTVVPLFDIQKEGTTVASMFDMQKEGTTVAPVFDMKKEAKTDVPLFDMQGLGDNNTATYLKLKYYEVLQTISNLSMSIEDYEKSIAESLVNALSGDNHTNNDIILVKQNFATFLSLIASCYVVYNWFFVMYFTNENGERVKTLELSLTKMKRNNPIFHFFFKYTLCVLSMMDKFALDIVPYTVSGFLSDRRLQFISLFVSIYLIINNFGSVILNSVDSTTIISVYVGIFVLYELYCVLCDFLPDENGSIDVSRMQKYMIVGAYTPLIYLMLFFVRLVWSIVLIGVTSFVNCAYILIMSFLAIPIYSSSSFLQTFKKMNDYIWESKKNEGGFLELSTSILYRFLYEISFILVLLNGVTDYSSNMSKTSQMSTIINCICYMFIFLFGFIAYQRYLMNGSLSTYIDPQKPSSTQPDLIVPPHQETVVSQTEIKNAQPDLIVPPHQETVVSQSEIKNDKFNFPENKSIDTKDSMIKDSTNMVKNRLVDTMMKAVKNSKYGKMIPTKLLSSIA
jgi:hypothetical protein